MPHQIYSLSRLFNTHNIKIYLVGGSIRDCLLSKIPSDFDFATSARVDKILEILRDYKTFRSGEKYGTIGVLFDGVKCEITTFRSDYDYLDNRHPNNIVFHNEISKDLERRDFTINAIAYDVLENKIIDKFNGIDDIKNKIIRCIGNPEDRFKEDSLRILRAFSFCSKLDFDISDETLESIKNLKYLINDVKIERKRGEIIKILNGKNPKKALFLMSKYRILDISQIPANINKIPLDCRIYSSFLIFKNLDYFNPNLEKKILIMQDIFDKIDTKKMKFIDRKILLASLSNEYGLENVERCLRIKLSLNKKMRILKKAFNKQKIARQINLKIDGNDILKLGFRAKEIKILKDYLLQKVIQSSIKNTKKELLKISMEVRKNPSDLI